MSQTDGVRKPYLWHPRINDNRPISMFERQARDEWRKLIDNEGDDGFGVEDVLALLDVVDELDVDAPEDGVELVPEYRVVSGKKPFRLPIADPMRNREMVAYMLQEEIKNDRDGKKQPALQVRYVTPWEDA